MFRRINTRFYGMVRRLVNMIQSSLTVICGTNAFSVQASHRTGSRTAHARSGGGSAEDPRRLRPRARAAGADEQAAGTRVQDARLAVGCVQGINVCTVPSHNSVLLSLQMTKRRSKTSNAQRIHAGRRMTSDVGVRRHRKSRFVIDVAVFPMT